MNTLKMLTATVVSFGILALGSALLAQQSRESEGQRSPEPERTANKGFAPLDPAVRALIEARLAAARSVFEQQLARHEQTLGPVPDDTSDWSRRWMEEQLRLSPAPAARLAAIQAHVERTKRLEKICEQYAKTGQGRTSDALKAKYFELEAEQLLAEFRASHPDTR